MAKRAWLEDRARRRRRLAWVTVAVVLVGAAAFAFARRDGDAPSAASDLTASDPELIPVYEDGSSDVDDATEWRPVADVVWRGDGSPDLTRCRVSVSDESGKVLRRYPMGFYVARGDQDDLFFSTTKVRARDLDAIPVDADVECEPKDTGRYEITDVRLLRGWQVAWRLPDASPGSSATCRVGIFDSRTVDREFPVLEPLVSVEVPERGETLSPSLLIGAEELENEPKTVLVRCLPGQRTPAPFEPESS